ncbi:hypothetical protein ABZ920_02645 [Streptomyces sp. NPDC046831]|uniref:hypothetical protein n=1 Tax=Streptomyces sp. NPDC046831 TaxID=3154805 RepID=UPI0033FF7787
MAEPGTTPHQAPLPLLRAAVFAVVGTVLGVCAHHLVAAGPVPWRQSAMAMGAFYALGLVGARQPRSLAAVAVTCCLAQAGLHVWLMAEHAAGAPPMTMAVPAHMRHAAGTHEALHERLHASWTMTAVHALAAVLVAVLLHRADTVCWSLTRGLTAAVDAVRVRIGMARTLLDRCPVPPVAGVCSPALVRQVRAPSRGAVLADVVVRRGPPGLGPLA